MQDKSLKQRFQAWVDERVFWLTYSAMRRHINRRPAIAYGLGLFIQRHLDAHPLSDDDKRRCDEIFARHIKEREEQLALDAKS